MKDDMQQMCLLLIGYNVLSTFILIQSDKKEDLPSKDITSNMITGHLNKRVICNIMFI